MISNRSMPPGTIADIDPGTWGGELVAP